MKLKEGFVLQKINSKFYAVPVGKLATRHKVLISMNDTCLFVWEKLQEQTSFQQLLEELTTEYDVDRETAQKDLTRFLTALEEAELME